MNIFLLRGLVREKNHWGNFQDQVAKAFPDDHIYTPEIQGVGEFVDTPSPDNFEEMVHFMRAQFKQQLESGEKNVLFAMSMGGMLARCWTELYPDDFQKLILVNTSFKGINSLFQRLRPKAVINFIQLFLTPNIGLRELGILRLVSNSPDKRQIILPGWIDIQKKRPVKRSSFINQIKAALKYDPPQTAPAKADLLFLAGARDRLCHYTSTVDLHSKWGGKMSIHPTAGHDIPIDDPDWLIHEMEQWLHREPLQ